MADSKKKGLLGFGLELLKADPKKSIASKFLRKDLKLKKAITSAEAQRLKKQKEKRDLLKKEQSKKMKDEATERYGKDLEQYKKNVNLFKRRKSRKAQRGMSSGGSVNSRSIAKKYFRGGLV